MRPPSKAATKQIASSLRWGVSDEMKKSRIQRFTVTERLLHWSFAAPQLVLMLTGAWLLIFAPGSGETVIKARAVMLHRAAGACFILLPLLVFLSGNTRTIVGNLRFMLSWSMDDLRWMYRTPLKVVIPSIKLPEVDKFNPGQKLNMLLVVMSGAAFALSGLIMWFAEGVLLAWIVHAAIFAFVILMVLGHVYMAILHPSTRPSFLSIITGHVDLDWAHHHYPQWARGVSESDKVER